MDGYLKDTVTGAEAPAIDWRSLWNARVASPGARATGVAARSAAFEPLARNGYALLEDLETARVNGLLTEMERFQSTCMAATKELWHEDPRHRSDCLDHWSRRWEYPYCGWSLHDREPGRLLDVGSGVGFFPFLLDRTGWQVTCVDLDPILSPRFLDANQRLGTNVSLRLATLDALPFEDGAFHAVTCVGALPWTPSRLRALDELARVLAPGGRLAITWDVCLSRDGAPRVEDTAELLAHLSQRLEPVYPLDLARPAGLLTTERMLDGQRWRLPWRPHRAWWRRALATLVHGDPFRTLAVMGTTWTKRG